MSIIEVKDLHKKYGINEVLKGVNIKVEKGSFTALLGTNGVGKSTLLNILMDIADYDRGEAFVLGKNIESGIGLLKSKVGFVSEDISFDFPSSIKDFISEIKHNFELFDEKKFYSLMDERKLEVTKNFSQFSRGQKGQIILNFALSHGAEVILIDEVTAVLDSEARKYYMDKLSNFCINDGGTVLLTTNIVTEIEYYATDLIILSHGQVRVAGSRVEIPKQFMKIRTNDPGCNPIFSDVNCNWSSRNNDGSSTYLISKEVASKYSQEGVLEDRRQPTLEEIFIYFAKEGGQQC